MESEALMIKTILRVRWRLMLLGLLALLVAGCGGDALRQCEETVSDLEAQSLELQNALSRSRDESQELEDSLAGAQDENQQLQETLAGAQDENRLLQETLDGARTELEELRAGPGPAEPDLDVVRERLWLLFHDRSPAVWACDDTASQVVPVVEMPSASPADLVEAINDRFGELNPAYESPGLALEGVVGDTAVVSLAQAEVVTEQMGSTGAQCYLAGVTFSLTSVEGIDHVRFDMKEGSHGSPGRYDRADYVYFLPLEMDRR
jgi:hypothetical protein